MLDILYVGNFRPVHSTETHIAKTLRELGHNVIPMQEDENNAEQLYMAVVEKAPDLFLWTRTWGIQGNAQELFVKLAQRGVPTVSYHLDLYWGISRQYDIAHDDFWKTKYCFTPDGGHAREFEAAGINHIYLRPGVFAPECVLGQPKREYSYNVLFVGSSVYHHEWPYRNELITWLRNEYQADFGKFGHPEPTIRNQELNDLYASARIVIGDSLCVGFDHPQYWSDRIYETIGRGGFIIHPFIKGLDEEFTDGKDIVFYEFGNFDQLRTLIDYYLAHPLEREQIRQAGHAKVKANYTYTHRMRQMLDILSKHERNIANKLLAVPA